MKKLLVAAAATLAVGLGTVGTANAGEAPTQTIAEIVVAATGSDPSEFNTLLAAVSAADPAVLAAIDECDDAPVTVFAPTDAAFAALPAGTIEAVLADQALLTDILLYHVLAGGLDSGTIAPLLPTTVDALNGDPISATLVDGDVVLNGTVNVISYDIPACNGFIHVIDAVLLPPADTPDPEVPATGSNSTIALLGGALIAIGALFTAATRRRAVTA